MDIFNTVLDYGRSAYEGVSSFFSSPKLKTVRDIAGGARDIVSTMRDTISGSGVQDFKPEGLVNPQTNLPGRVGAPSRSSAGRPSFSDVGEASYYKYAQLQNTIRYLYGTKSRYKSIAKDRS
jgi:hypothetical protein